MLAMLKKLTVPLIFHIFFEVLKHLILNPFEFVASIKNVDSKLLIIF